MRLQSFDRYIPLHSPVKADLTSIPCFEHAFILNPKEIKIKKHRLVDLMD